MQVNRNAFSMIELIFVIVIIGILAAVAIPKLAATRDDAKEATICQNIATCVRDLAAKYTATQSASSSDSIACGNLPSSVSLSVSTNSVTVGNAPSMCSNMNTITVYGGNRVSL